MYNNKETTVEPFLRVLNIRKVFIGSSMREFPILDDVNLEIQPSEIVSLLGRSGSGKSTLLRIIAGVGEKFHGKVFHRGNEVKHPIGGLSMVFQSFALLPWLTVLENVQLALEAQEIFGEKKIKRALEAIDTVGLDGFESAYPRELSGGMSQRAGIARALSSNPDVLLMDEPFSALDVLTADNLRGDLLRILRSKLRRSTSVLLVTHNIEEAITMSDRILIFATHPGYVRAEISVGLPHPRNPKDFSFRTLVDQVYILMTQGQITPEKSKKTIGIGYELPNVDTSEIIGFVEQLYKRSYNGFMNLSEIADALRFEIDDLFPVMEALNVLHLARIHRRGISLTRRGYEIAIADILKKKKLFRKHLFRYIPLISYIKKTLNVSPKGEKPKGFFIDRLEKFSTEYVAHQTLKTIIEWGRYAEIFAYDANTDNLNLKNPT